jgi:predicted glycosyl hydrolase (DUF1957 family)
MKELSKSEKAAVEWGILIALFKATVEQKQSLIDEEKNNAEEIFQHWKNMGDQLLELIENLSDLEQLESVSDMIHDSVAEIKKINGI